MNSRVLLFFIFLAIYNCSYCQMSNDSLEIAFVSCSNKMTISDTNKFVFRIKNCSSDFLLILPEEKYAKASEKYINPILYYELIRVNQDSIIDLTAANNHITFSNKFYYARVFRILYPYETQLLRCYPEKEMLAIYGKGLYKIRIVLDASILNKHFGVVSSEWIKFKIE